MSDTATAPGDLTIDVVDASIGAAEFYERYFLPERPVLVRGVGAAWPARERWRPGALRAALERAEGVQAHDLYYVMPRGTFGGDYTIPPCVARVLDSDDVFALQSSTRIWVNVRGNVSHWHYDSNLEGVFNVQVRGRKSWRLVSPHTPLPCYPFSNFALLGEDEALLRGVEHRCTVTEEGDMLFVPPLWFHKVVAEGEENVNLNWVATKRRDPVPSPALARELERYCIDRRFRRHHSAWVRRGYAAAMRRMPPYLRVVWRYPEFIETPPAAAPWMTLRHVLRECGAGVRALGSLARLRRTLARLDRVVPLGRT